MKSHKSDPIPPDSPENIEIALEQATTHKNTTSQQSPQKQQEMENTTDDLTFPPPPPIGIYKRANYFPFLCLFILLISDLIAMNYTVRTNDFGVFWIIPLKWIFFYVYLSIFIYKRLNIFNNNGSTSIKRVIYDGFIPYILGFHPNFIYQYGNQYWYKYLLDKIIIYLWFMHDIICFIVILIMKLNSPDPVCWTGCSAGRATNAISYKNGLSWRVPYDVHFVMVPACLLAICGIAAASRVVPGRLSQQQAGLHSNKLLFYAKNDSNNTNISFSSVLNTVNNFNNNQYSGINWLLLVIATISHITRAYMQAVFTTVDKSWYVYVAYGYWSFIDLLWVLFTTMVINTMINTVLACTKLTKTFFKKNNFSNSNTNNTGHVLDKKPHSTQVTDSSSTALSNSVIEHARYDFFVTDECERFWVERYEWVHNILPVILTYSTIIVSAVLFGWLVLFVYVGYVVIVFGAEGVYLRAIQWFSIELMVTIIAAIFLFQQCTNLHSASLEHVKRLQNELVVLYMERSKVYRRYNDGNGGNDEYSSGGGGLAVIDNNIGLLKVYSESIPITDAAMQINLVFFKIKANDVTANSLKALATTLAIVMTRIYFD